MAGIIVATGLRLSLLTDPAAEPPETGLRTNHRTDPEREHPPEPDQPDNHQINPAYQDQTARVPHHRTDHPMATQGRDHLIIPALLPGVAADQEAVVAEDSEEEVLAAGEDNY